MTIEHRKKWVAVVLLVSALVAPFILFSTPLSSWHSKSNASQWVIGVQNGLYPIEWLWQSLTKGLGRAWYSYVNLSNAAEENRQLRGHLAALQTRIMDYDEQVLENDRLRKLLGFSGRSEKKLIAAEVVGHNDHAQFESIRITRGKADGLKIGMPVMAADGVVGKVIRTGEHFADVQLLVDTDFHVDVLLQRTRVRGVLSGASRTLCTLQLHKRVEIRIGDTLITSGIVGGFPKGLPVGRVMRISYETENVAQAVTVEPWVDYRRLEEVMVILNADPELEKIAETAGNAWLEKAVDQAYAGSPQDLRQGG